MSYILGVKIDEYSFSEVMQKIINFLKENKLHQICTVNPEFIVAAQNDSVFKDILNNSDLNVPDGVGLKYAAIYKRQKIGERITGVDLTWELCKMASERSYSVYFLGGKPGIAKKASSIIKKLYPELKIAGTDASNPNDAGLIEKINKSGADILLVAYGAPKQDKFIYKLKNQKSKIKNTRIAIGVGGTFDYISGEISRAPKWVRSIGLEWLYRLIRQPSRIKRIYTAVIKFPVLLIFNRSK
jgi:N-acetylglucosaminyldiphosphoundecaprenol N-acetyl-beta-D-mannosaminyltransferase